MKNCLAFTKCYCLSSKEYAILEYAINTIVNNHKDTDAFYLAKSIDTAVYCILNGAIDDQAFAEEMEIEKLKTEHFEKENSETIKQEETQRIEEQKQGKELMKKFISEYDKYKE